MINKPENKRKGSVLVLGGGIAGVQASLDIAESGFYVYLVENSPAIGGVMAQLDKTFPTNDCSMCILSPKLVECGRHLNINVMTYTEFEKLKGVPGDFQAVVRKKARYVRPERCTGCGECFEVCPIKVPDDFDKGMQYRKAIYKPYPQAFPNIAVIDKTLNKYNKKSKTVGTVCIECMKCVKACKANAIDHDMVDEIIELNVGAVVIASGFKEYNPGELYKYGYSRYPNVLTSLEFERMLSASGPFRGEIIRPKDKKHPKKIAFLQCIGSRDENREKSYCSSVCCMYAIKESIIAKEHSKENLDVTIFYMDIRCHGKDFEKYYNRAKDSFSVNFERSKVYDIEELPNGNLQLKYSDEKGTVQTAEFDMVILSVGLTASSESIRISRRLRLGVNEDGFIRSREFLPGVTYKEGIYTCGAINGPKDIPETVAEASAVSACVSEFLNKKRNTLTKQKEYPREINVFNIAPRIGVFVCHCGTNIGSVVNVKEVSDFTAKLKSVVYVEECQYACSQDIQEHIKSLITDYALNRIVIASCSPRTHEALFQETIKEAGLNKYLFEMVNIRDQCSWVHSKEPEKATEKAKDLVEMAVNKTRVLTPLDERTSEVLKSALIIGGGVSGMNAALNLARQGFNVYLVEKEKELGGFARNIKFNSYGESISSYLELLVSKVKEHICISVYTNSIVGDVEGYIGNYNSKIKNIVTEEVESIKHGVVLISVGGREYEPEEYQYRENGSVIKQSELEAGLDSNPDFFKKLKNIAFVQCVGSRNERNPNCSRVCCHGAVKNAIKLKELNPKCNVFVFYRDIRTYGRFERFYRKARKLGVIFIHFDPICEPDLKVLKNGKLKIIFNDKIVGKKFEIDVDRLVLSVGIVSNDSNSELAQIFKVPLNEEGFFLEAHAKLRPVDFATDGVYLAGTCHSPKTIEESITQAFAASGRAITVVSKDALKVNAITATINEEICAGCMACVSVCPYKAIDFDEYKKICKVNEALCKGCGACAASCRSGAADLCGFTNEQIFNLIDSLDTNK